MKNFKELLDKLSPERRARIDARVQETLANMNKCMECGKEISDEEYVVNWGSCNHCFDSHLEPIKTKQDGEDL